MNQNQSFSNYNFNTISMPDSGDSFKKSKRKKRCIILISVIAALIIVGVIIAIIFALKKKDKKKSIPNEEEAEHIPIEIKYTQDELRFFNIEKNISSTIKGEEGEENQREQNNTLYYVCTMGILNKTSKGNINETYYEGFFAILSIVHYNSITGEKKLIKDNMDLINIINKENDNQLLETIQTLFNKRSKLSRKEEVVKEETLDTIEDDLVKPFLRLEFYQNGSYRNIYRPKDLSQKSFDEMKEFLDVIIPQISNETFETVEEKRKENIKAKLAKLSENKDKKIYKIRRRLDQNEKEEKNGMKVKDKDTNSNDSYYIESESFNSTNLIENEEELKTNRNKPTIKRIGNNETEYNESRNSAVYSDFTKYRGSNFTKNVSTIIDSNNTIREIFYKSYIKLLKQDYIKKSDKETYSSDNYLDERNVLVNDSEINITDPNNTMKNETEEENINSTDINYNLKDADSLYSLIEGHIKVNCTYYNRELIKDIYDNYLNKYKYENDNNKTLRMLRAFKNIMPIKDLDKYEIIEIDPNKRRLELEEENKYFYGLKKSSYRKNIFQTDFLGLDIALGITNTYVPSTGQSSVSFKMDLGDLKISHDIKSFKTNQPILIENTQQMIFKLLQLIYSSHKNIEEKSALVYQNISSKLQKFMENENLNIKSKDKFTKSDDYYSLISNNNETFKNIFLYLLNNITEINNDLHNPNKSNTFESFFENSTNYLDININNKSEEYNNSIEEIKKLIYLINEEFEKNNTEKIEPFLLEDLNSVIKGIKSYLKEDYDKILMNQINEEKKNYISEIKENINKIMNLNPINSLKEVIQNNPIFNSICSVEDKNYLLSNLTNIRQFLLFQKESELNSVENKFNNTLQNIINKNNNYSSFLPEIKNITENGILNLIMEELNEYFSNSDEIDETLNELMIKNIKNLADISYNETQKTKNLINNMTLIISNKILEIGKNIKNYLINSKNNKIQKIRNFHNEFFENNMYKYYNITEQKNKYILDEDSKTLSSFESDFINSVKNTIIFWGMQTIDSNLNLAYQYLNEAKYYVDECYEECDDLGFFDFFVRDCDCEYYLNIDFINRLQDMSENSYKLILDYLNSEEFNKIIEEYFYSFEDEFKSLNIIIENEIFNESEFFYLKSVQNIIDFNFTLIKDNIFRPTVRYLEEYGITQSSIFLIYFNNFNNKKEGTVSNKDYDIKLDDYYFSSSEEECVYRNNYLLISNGNKSIVNNLKNDKTNISNNYFQKLKEYNDFYQKYYYDLNSSFENILKNDDYLIDLYMMLENYCYEIKQYLDDLINNNLEQSLIQEFENNIINNSLSNQTEYLKILINNFYFNYSNTSYMPSFFEEKSLIEKYDLFVKYINYTQQVSINTYTNYTRTLLQKKIDAIYDLNKYILNYIIISNGEQIKNGVDKVQNTFKDIDIMIQKYKNDTLLYNNKINNNNLIFDNSSFSEKYSSNIFLSLFSNNYYNNDSISKYMKEIRINREVDRLIKIINKIKSSFDTEKNLFSTIEEKNLDLIYEQIKLNITTQSETIFNDYILPEKKGLIKNFSFELFEEIYKDNYISNEINNIIKGLIPKIDGNFSNEVKQDLNILYKDLFNLTGKLISLKYQENEFNIDNETDIYYEKIINHLNLINAEEIKNSNETLNISEDELIKEIELVLYKRINEKNINSYESYISKQLEKYENLKKEINFKSSIGELFEKYHKKNLINSYMSIYKNITKNIFNIVEFDKNKISFDEIKKIVIDTYEKNLNEFKTNFIYRNNSKIKNEELMKLIEGKIENILSKIKNVIEKSSNETFGINKERYYLKKHIFNIYESQFTSVNKINQEFSDYFQKNTIKMKYINLLLEKLYSSKIERIIIDNFENYLTDYYSRYYESEINNKIILFDKYHNSLIFDFAEQFIKSKLFYIHYLLLTKNNFSNITKQKINKIPKIISHIFYEQIFNNNIMKSKLYFNDNKDLLIKEYMSRIFEDEFMRSIFLSDNIKNSFLYNDEINMLFENYTSQLIKEKSINNLNYYFSEGIYNLSDVNNIYNIIEKIGIIISEFSPLIPNKNNANLSELIIKLYNEYDKLKINEKLIIPKNLSENATQEREQNNNEIIILNNIVKAYSDFVRYFNIEFKDLIEKEIETIKYADNHFESMSTIADEIINITNNYSFDVLNEIENYYEKLKVYGMIDGLINIPLDKAEALSQLWDYTPSQITLRNLQHPYRKKIKFKKMLEYYNKQDKNNKKEILSKIEKIMEANHNSRYLEEYNLNYQFNSSCVPLSYYNISNMISILIDDIQNLQNSLNNNEYFAKFKLIYESLKFNSDNNENLSKINKNLISDELSKFSLFTSENYDYLENLINIITYNTTEKILLKKELKLINSIENVDFYQKFKECIISSITATYTFYTNIINVQSKTITNEDTEKYNNFLINLNDIEKVIDFIEKSKIFTYSKYLIEQKLIPFEREVKNVVKDIIVEVISNILFSSEDKFDLDYKFGDDKEKDVKIENNKEKNNNKKDDKEKDENKKDDEDDNDKKKEEKEEEDDDDDPIGDLILGYELDNKHLASYCCYSIDVINLILKAITQEKDVEYSIKFPCPSFPFLQLTIIPTLDFDICVLGSYEYLDENKYPVSKLLIDFSTEVDLGVKVEGGIYLDAKLASFSIAVGVDGKMFCGKIGLKLTFDFDQAKVNFNIYSELFSASFQFYLEINIKILFWTENIKFSYDLSFDPIRYNILDESFDLYDKKRKYELL